MQRYASSLKRGVNKSSVSHFTTVVARESLDTERIAFTMFNLWQGKIERDTIAKLNGNF